MSSCIRIERHMGARGREWPLDLHNIQALLHRNTVKLKKNPCLASRKNCLSLNQGSLGVAHSLAHYEYTPCSYSGGPVFEYQPRGKLSRCLLGFLSPQMQIQIYVFKTGRGCFHLHPLQFINHNQNMI